MARKEGALWGQPACPPGMSHGSAEQCVEGGAGVGAKMSAKSRMEDCGEERQPWLRGGRAHGKAGPDLPS